MSGPWGVARVFGRKDKCVTLAEFLAEWLELVVKPTKRHNTYTSYRNAVGRHIVPVLGRLRHGKPSPRLMPRTACRWLDRCVRDGWKA